MGLGSVRGGVRDSRIVSALNYISTSTSVMHSFTTLKWYRM